jgi:BirA family biotin operon repressor/biotin-[acetyl-CoA-carboxylase] ligase
MIGEPFIILPTIESTNNHAKALVKEGMASNGMAIFAEEQTHGRGQQNHTWESQKGQNIILTLVVDGSQFNLDAQFQLSCVTALACHDLFSKYAGEETSIKWPNDLFWRDRKAGGILIENVIKGNTWEKAIVGIGINVNQVVFGNMKSTPVSLKQITGKSYAAIDLAKELCACLQIRYNQLQETCFNILLEEYNHKLYKVNQSVLFQNGTDQLEATVRGVAENGQLIIEHSKTELAEHGKLVWLL